MLHYRSALCLLSDPTMAVQPASARELPTLVYLVFRGRFGNRPHAFYNNHSRDTMSDQDLKAELERLRAENAALKQRGSASIKVSEKGAVSVYGLGRFPFALP